MFSELNQCGERCDEPKKMEGREVTELKIAVVEKRRKKEKKKRRSVTISSSSSSSLLER